MNRSIRNKAIALLSAAALTSAAVACGDDDADETPVTTEDTEETTDTTEDMSDDMDDMDDMDDDGEEADGNIVEVAIAAGDFTILAELLTEAGLVDTLSGEGPFTVFAPTDAAFEAVDEDLLATVAGDSDLLTTVLTYHVVAGEVLAADVLEMDGESVETLAGATLTISVSGETVSLVDVAGQEVAVINVDIMASNGVIHVIESVLLPVDPSEL